MILEHALLPVRPGHETASEAAFATARGNISSEAAFETARGNISSEAAFETARGNISSEAAFATARGNISSEAAFATARGIISSMPGFIDLELARGIESPGTYLLLVHHFYDPYPVVDHFAGV